jgi:L-malate glycosyltransferase
MSELPGPPLSIAVLGDFDGPHTRAWVRTFVERGHDVHAISFYAPRTELPGLTVHVLSGGQAPTSAQPQRAPSPAKRLPPSLMRLVHAWRYRRAGLRRVLDEIKPDVFHAHYAVEHGFYGAFAGYHPYMISAWGSDLLVESRKTLGGRIAKWALSKADLVTGNDASLVQRAVELGVPPEKAALVHLGIESTFLDAGVHSVNLSDGDDEPLTAISFRALEPLYNIDVILRAFAAVQDDFPNAQLIVANDGSLSSSLTNSGNSSVEFVGKQDQSWLAERLARSHVAVSVPSSDSLALSNLEAMAAGAFPIVSDLPSIDGWLEDGINGLRVPVGNQEALINAIRRALSDPELRRRAAMHNRQLVEARGLREPNMLLMERYYYRLAGHPVEDQAI